MIRKATGFIIALGIAVAILGQTTAGVPTQPLVAVVHTVDNPATQPVIMPEVHRQRQHEDFVKEVAKRKGNVDLVFVGDSITQGWSIGGKDVWKTCYGDLKPLNLGMGSNRVEHAIWRVQNGEFEGITPKVVVILIGVNNLYQNPVCTARQIAAGVATLINEMHQRSPATKFLLVGVFPSGDKDSGYRARAMEINALLIKFDDGKSVRFLDFGEKLLEPDGSASPEILYDKLHLTAKAYAIWAAAMNPLLGEMLGAKLPAPIPPGATAQPANSVPAATAIPLPVSTRPFAQPFYSGKESVRLKQYIKDEKNLLAYGLNVVPPWADGGILEINFPEHMEYSPNTISILHWNEPTSNGRWEVAADGLSATLDVESSYRKGIFIRGEARVTGKDRVEVTMKVSNKTQVVLGAVRALFCHHYRPLEGFTRRRLPLWSLAPGRLLAPSQEHPHTMTSALTPLIHRVCQAGEVIMSIFGDPII